MTYGLEVTCPNFVLKNGETSQKPPYSATWKGSYTLRTQNLNDPGHLWNLKERANPPIALSCPSFKPLTPPDDLNVMAQ